jgi:hypothetical protein
MRRLGEEKPDLILMDVVMPGQNGFQLTRAITRDPRFSRCAGHHVHEQESGDRPGLGHAPGRQGLHRQARQCQTSCSPRSSSSTDDDARPAHRRHGQARKPCANSRTGWPPACRRCAPSSQASHGWPLIAAARAYWSSRCSRPGRSSISRPALPGTAHALLVDGRGQPARRPLRRGRSGRLPGLANARRPKGLRASRGAWLRSTPRWACHCALAGRSPRAGLRHAADMVRDAGRSPRSGPRLPPIAGRTRGARCGRRSVWPNWPGNSSFWASPA